MLICEEDGHILIRIATQYFADFIQCLSGDNYLSGRIAFLQLDLPDGDTVSVQRSHTHGISVDFEQFTAHQPVAVIVGDGKNGLADYFLQGKLGQKDGIVPFDHRQIGKILSGFADDVEFRLFTGDGSLKIGIRRNCNIVVRQLPDDFQENFGIQGDDSLFDDSTVNDGFDSQFHIVGGQLDLSLCRIDQNALQNGHGSFIGNGFGYYLKAVQQISFGTD